MRVYTEETNAAGKVSADPEGPVHVQGLTHRLSLNLDEAELLGKVLLDAVDAARKAHAR
ncbi:hypothetical protein ACTHQW_13755 [Dietzia maris]